MISNPNQDFIPTRPIPLSTRLSDAISQGESWLLDRQHEEGFWVGMLESNSCMEAQWILAMHFLGIEDEKKRAGMVASILNEQRADGSWEVYHNAPAGDINTTVECYAALRSAGYLPDAEVLSRAREWIFARGGLSQTRVFTRYWLALIGEWPWSATPTLPPELICTPLWFPFNIYHFASWARATIIPLSVLSARRPVRPLPPKARLDELYPEGRGNFDYRLTPKKRFFSWESFFFMADRLLSRYVEFPIQPGRGLAIRLCLDWVIKHQDADGAWGGIQPPWIYSLMALHTEGYGIDHPVVANGVKALDAHWSYERDGGLYIQASESPVWDTVLTLQALLDSGRAPADCPAMTRAIDWIVQKQVTAPGDWQVKVSSVMPGGWSFERANDSYPDVDDTAVAILVLARAKSAHHNPTRIEYAIKRAVRWILALQSSNGGWASFDRDNTNSLLTKLPFCDFGEVLDPPTVDVTAHVVEAMAYLGWTIQDRPIARALAFIKEQQEEDGSWFGRWGVNHIYGTAAVLPALAAVGEDLSAKYVSRAGDWIVAHQNADGGWGETPASYVEDSLRGVGDSTASQTAWALMALLAIPTSNYHQSIQAGIDYLLAMQCEGTWHEPQYTGTGFPGYGVGSRLHGESHDRTVSIQQGLEVGRGFMINYNLYRHYFPLMALSRARSRIEASERDTIAKLVAAVQAPALDMSFLPSLPSTAPARRRYRGGIVARHLIRKTAKLLSRRF
ncbi:MAG: squalene-hopene/tetraprenyl-beta-curcumene cyclase [Verrucomicrobiota bacterium]|jgi:squalene-hopene/tetraprenyl-beta-curcumene cyclase|nr:squalene-hopene/tetraprenyl-beta-curcumene cyclase [Verrucomicrobiota bacterium]